MPRAQRKLAVSDSVGGIQPADNAVVRAQSDAVGMDTTQPSTLTGPQANFVYNAEVLDMPVKAAAAEAGMPLHQVADPSVISARFALRKELQGRLDLTKEDVLFGIKEAIRDARILQDPMAQIKGFEAISKMLGFDAPKEVKVTIDGTIDVVKKNISKMPDSDLIKLLGADNIIDGDFHEIGKTGS